MLLSCPSSSMSMWRLVLSVVVVAALTVMLLLLTVVALLSSSSLSLLSLLFGCLCVVLAVVRVRYQRGAA